MTDTFIKRMEEGCNAIGICLSQKQMEQFFQYYEKLVETNRVMNLTAITEEADVVEKHFLDSLLLKRALERAWIDWEEGTGYSLIDVGTGAGFPGIPLKIAFPELQVVLLDSLNKRVGFLNEITAALGLSGIRAFHGRAEDYGRNPEYREQFDFSVSRAVANLSTLSEYCIPFVKLGGYFIPYKSGKAREEIEDAKLAIKKLGADLEKPVILRLPGTDVDRTFVPVKKLGITPKRYPRKAGMPAKEPIRK